VLKKMTAMICESFAKEADKHGLCKATSAATLKALQRPHVTRFSRMYVTSHQCRSSSIM
jgi:hypothetical protein